MNNNHPQLIYKAELIDKKIVFTFNSQHIPTLDYIHGELGYHITETRAMQKTKEEIKSAPIVKPFNSLKDFLRRK
jgi:hypothetical protein